MKIKEIELKNFKCFKHLKVSIPKITLLTGANSSGKSSFINSILGVLQSVDFPYEYSLNGDYVQMGGFEDVYFKSTDKNTKKIFDINFVLNNNTSVFKFDTTWKNSVQRKIPRLSNTLVDVNNKYFTMGVKCLNKEFIFNANINITEADKNFLAYAQNIFTEQIKGLNESKQSVALREKLLRDLKEPANNLTFTVKGFNDISSNLKDEIFIQQQVNQVREALSLLRKSTNYVSSFRLHPQRTYYESAKSTLKVQGSGDNYIDQIVYWKEQGDERFNELNRIMKAFGLLDDIKINRLGGGRYEVLVNSKKDTAVSAITDVGFGISQFLPIIVADLQLNQNSTLIVSQPEIHLHPSVQAELGNYLVKQAYGNNKNYIIETHSEYLINRLRYLVMTGKLKEEDIKIIHFENTQNGTIPHELRLVKNGSIEGAPKDFFDTYMLDVSAIMKQTFINAQS